MYIHDDGRRSILQVAVRKRSGWWLPNDLHLHVWFLWEKMHVSNGTVWHKDMHTVHFKDVVMFKHCYHYHAVPQLHYLYSFPFWHPLLLFFLYEVLWSTKIIITISAFHSNVYKIECQFEFVTHLNSTAFVKHHITLRCSTRLGFLLKHEQAAWQ